MRVLLVEDDIDLAANVGEYLESRGHAVVFAYNGLSGLQEAVSGRWDAMILDLGLPGADGISVASSAEWIIGGQVSDVGGLLETLAAEYPTTTITLADAISAPASGDTATATFQHLTGSAGTIQANVTTDGTLVEIVATSLPGRLPSPGDHTAQRDWPKL